MREEIADWIVQAKADLRKARILFDAGEYDGVAFYCHQSVGKFLKALMMKKKNKGKGGHSVIYVAKELGVPEDLFEKVKKINPEYLISRYPDIAGIAPVDYYSKGMVEDYFGVVVEVMEWVKKQM